MTGEAPDLPEIRLQGKVKDPFFCIGNEVVDAFLPIIGPDCFAVHSYFMRKRFSDPKLKHSVRGLARKTGLGITTISRSLEVLELLGLVKVIRFGGGRRSECQLFDSRELAIRLGAVYHRNSLSFSLPPKELQRLTTEIRAIRGRQQRKPLATQMSNPTIGCGNLTLPVSQRNAGVSIRVRQRSTRETQAGSYLIREERRIEEVPSPTPSHDCEAQKDKDKDSPDEEEPDGPLKWAVVQFTGVMNDLGDCLFNLSRPPNSFLANGAADWEKFGFNSLAVEAAAWRGGALELTLSASDPETARRGLEKYHRTFDASLRTWYGCEVKISLVKGHRQRCCDS